MPERCSASRRRIVVPSGAEPRGGAEKMLERRREHYSWPIPPGLMMSDMISMLSKVPVLGLLVLAAISVTFGDYSAKYWSAGGGNLWYFLAFVGYAGSGFFFLPTLLRDGLVVASVMWVVLSMAGDLFVGIVLFKEVLAPLQIVGVLFGLVSVLLLAL